MDQLNPGAVWSAQMLPRTDSTLRVGAPIRSGGVASDPSPRQSGLSSIWWLPHSHTPLCEDGDGSRSIVEHHPASQITAAPPPTPTSTSAAHTFPAAGYTCSAALPIRDYPLPRRVGVGGGGRETCDKDTNHVKVRTGTAKVTQAFDPNCHVVRRAGKSHRGKKAAEMCQSCF